MSIKRIVDTSFWEDEKVMEDFSTDDRLFMLYLMTNPHSTQLGIYKINEKQIAFEIGFSVEQVKELLDKFENQYGMIRYSLLTREIAIKNYLCYSLLSGGKPVLDLLLKEVNKVKDKSLIEYIEPCTNKTNNKTVKDLFNIIHTKNNNINQEYNHIISNQKSYHDSYHESEKCPNLSAYPHKDGLIHENDVVINEPITNRGTNRPTYRDTNHNPKYERIITITSDYGKGEAK